MILDGWGIAANPAVSAIDQGRTPFVDSLSAYPTSQLQASGRSVGLPDGQMGNSEVGHMNLGAGRIVYQDLVKIDLAIEERRLLQKPRIPKPPSDRPGKETPCAGPRQRRGRPQPYGPPQGLTELIS